MHKALITCTHLMNALMLRGAISKAILELWRQKTFPFLFICKYPTRKDINTWCKSLGEYSISKEIWDFTLNLMISCLFDFLISSIVFSCKCDVSRGSKNFWTQLQKYSRTKATLGFNYTYHGSVKKWYKK